MEKPRLDVRQLPVEQQADAVIRAFDALATGEAFVLVTTAAPRHILPRLQHERIGQFDWNVLEAGPARWRIDVQRRGEAGVRQLTEFVNTDHRRLYETFETVGGLIEQGRCAEAATLFLEFRCGVNRHLDAEEQFLYPEYEKVAGTRSGDVASLRAEHVAIRRLMDDLARAIDQRKIDQCREVISGMAKLFESHVASEESLICPAMDRATPEPARQTLLSNMQGI